MTADPLVLHLRDRLAGLGPRPLGLAVSGGGDSMALMHLAAEAGLAARVATVDHGLRAAAAAEAAMVAARAGDLGYGHDTLRWDGRQATGNLADQARRARRDLLAAWARRHGLAAVLLAHTQDDVAETFLMRLARGAGVDGLSAMAETFAHDGVTFRRPLLDVPRKGLRDWLADRHLDWAEDPTNRDDRYDRARARKALGHLAPLGLDAARLSEVAGHLAQARAALQAGTAALLAEAVQVVGAGLALRLDGAALARAPQDLRRRALVAAILWLCPADYAPRGAQVETLASRLMRGEDSQLGGARFLTRKGVLWACRDPGLPLSAHWSAAGASADVTLRPLGADGLAECPGWRALGLPRPVLLSAPSLWQGRALLAAPHAGRPGGTAIRWSGPAQPEPPGVLSH